MKAKLEIDMPKMCCDCPCFEIQTFYSGRYMAYMGVPCPGKCRALPIKTLDGRVIDYQQVSTNEEIENKRRSKFCPLKECGK